MNGKRTVLFLCTHNAARSQMGEALLRKHAGDRFEVLSAGLEPGEVHPLTHRALNEIGIDTSELRSKSVMDFLGKTRIHIAIIVCENAKQNCPSIYPNALEVLYWPLDDPAAAEGSEEQRLAQFRNIRDEIDEKLHEWLATIDEPAGTREGEA
ncbi:MAG: arsenate reductase ArsC [Planctomycetota bacterium]|nr:arsenate reductase ArsC [Planctomycetota bacterium]